MGWLNTDDRRIELEKRGEPIAVYQPSRLEVIGCFWFAILMLLCGIGLILTAAWSYGANFASHEGVAVLLLVAGVAILGFGIYLRIMGRRERQRRVYLYDDGLLIISHSGAVSARYQEMEAVWADVTHHYQDGIYVHTTHVYTVHCRDGTRFVVNDECLQAEKVGNLLQEEATRYLLPKALELYETDRPVCFGRLAVSRNGISDGAKHLNWQDVKGLRVERGEISISKEGKWFAWSTVSVAETPNLFVFLALVSRIIESHA